ARHASRGHRWGGVAGIGAGAPADDGGRRRRDEDQQYKSEHGTDSSSRTIIRL
ncbi:hypothetical protein G3I32_09540, partial [Streptomyces coelicoflavus]|nr:hypothetical protein [Streptomyces coelicoflavus]